MLLSSFGQATNDSISLFSSNPIQSDTYKRLEVGDTANLEDWFPTAWGFVYPATFKIIDPRMGTVNGSTLTVTNWGQTRVTIDDANGAFAVVALEVRPKGAFAMPMIKGGYNQYGLALKADGTVWRVTAQGIPYQVSGGDTGSEYLENIIEIACGVNGRYALDINGELWSWGWDNGQGYLGLGLIDGSVSNPKKVNTDGNIVVHIGRTAGTLQYIARNGRVYAAGNSYAGELGVGDYNKHGTPDLVWYLSNVVDVVGESWTSTSYLDFWGRVWQTGWNMGGTAIAPNRSGNHNGMSSYPIMVPKTYLSRIVEIEVIGNEDASRWALNADGELFRWGSSYYVSSGEAPATGFASTVVKYTKLSDVIRIKGTSNNASDGYVVMAAQTSDGTLYTWGYGMYGSLGTSGWLTHEQANPTAVNITDVAQFNGVACYHNFAVVRYDGSVYAWGRNTEAELGDSSKTNRGTPVRSGANGDGTLMLRMQYGEVTGGGATKRYDHTNPLPSTITLEENETLTIYTNQITKGRYGGYWLIDPPAPQVITGSLEINSTDTAIAMADTRNIRSGYITINPNQTKTYGETTITVRDVDSGLLVILRVRVKPTDAVAVPMVSTGMARVIALKADGTVWGWGRNDCGDAGNGSVAPYIVRPEQTVLQDGSPLTDVIQIASGGTTSYALKADGTVWAWGDNSSSQLGIEETSKTPTPYAIQVKAGDCDSADGYLHDIIRIAAGTYSAYAISKTGEAFAWGRGTEGQLGMWQAQDIWLPRYMHGYVFGIERLSDVVDISASYSAAMVLLANGTVATMGSNEKTGGLGNGTAICSAPMLVWDWDYDNSVQVGYLQNITEVSAGGISNNKNSQTFFALNTDGEVLSWGYGTNYALGHGDTSSWNLPKRIEALVGEKIIHIAAMSAGDTEIGCAAMTADRKTYTWGGTDNSRGPLGNGTTTTLHTTPKLTTPQAFDLVSFVGARNCGYVGTKQDGSVWGWGGNWYAQLGDRFLEPKSAAILVHGLFPSVQVNGAAIYRGRTATAAYGADAGAAGTQCP